MIPLPLPYADENPLPGRNDFLITLIVINVVAAPTWGPETWSRFGFIPSLGIHEPWRWVTSQFLHGDATHLLGNMWFLWLFGDNIEAHLKKWFLPFYIAGGFAANGLYMFMNPASNIPCVGASGAISAVIGAYIVIFPGARLKCFSVRSFWSTSGPGYCIINFTISALVFGVLYLLGQFLLMSLESGSNVAHGAHIGGMIFGFIVGFLTRGQNTETAMALSGDGEHLPGAIDNKDRVNIESLIRDNKEQEALEAYIVQVRQNPYFDLSANAQIWIADRLSRLGHPHLARNALNTFMLRRPEDGLTGHALLLLGYIEQAHFRNYDAAARAYQRVEQLPSADSKMKENAAVRRNAAETVLRRTFASAPVEGARYCIFLETPIPLTGAQVAELARLIGDDATAVQRRLKSAPGILVRGLEVGKSGKIAGALEAAGIPVAVVAENDFIDLPKPRAIGALGASPAGLSIPEVLSLEDPFPWERVLMIAGVGIVMKATQEKTAGLFEVSDVSVSGTYHSHNGAETLSDPLYVHRGGPNKTYETLTAMIPVIEIVTQEPLMRLCWSPALDLKRDPKKIGLYFDALQELIFFAKNVPVDHGAQAAFSRRLPKTAVFSEKSELDVYISWQAQLASLKKRSSYR